MQLKQKRSFDEGPGNYWSCIVFGDTQVFDEFALGFIMLTG
jgi:hypothetical protein